MKLPLGVRLTLMDEWVTLEVDNKSSNLEFVDCKLTLGNDLADVE